VARAAGAGTGAGTGAGGTVTGCSFVQITDHHLRPDEREETGGRETAAALRATLAHLAAHDADVDFVVCTGDVVETPDDASYAFARELLGTLGGMPLRVLPGNHDDRDRWYAWMAPDGRPGGRHHWAFERGGVQFVGVDWGTGGEPRGEPGLYDFLRERLRADTPTVVFTHHHVVPTGIPWVDALLTADVEEFGRLLRGAPVLGVFSGHAHCTYESTLEGVPVWGLRSTAPQFAREPAPRVVHLPPHYRRVDVRDGRLATRIVEVAP